MPAQQVPYEVASRCRALVVEFLAAQDWRLADLEQLVSAVQDGSAVDRAPALIRRRTLHEYSKILHAACCQQDDQPRRERAFRELHRYLYRSVYRRWPERAEDITQQALLIVVEQLDRCRYPGAFLSFALYKSRDAMKRQLRNELFWQTRTVPLAETLRFSGASSPYASVLAAERMEEIRSAITQLPLRLQQVLLLKYEAGKTDAEIADDLGITVGYVRVLRNRARTRLRASLQRAEARGG